MKVEIFPPCLIFTNCDLPEGYAGLSSGPVIRLKSGYENDIGIIEHEKLHVSHFYTFALVSAFLLYQLQAYLPYPIETMLPLASLPFSLLYRFVPKFKEWEEIQCYKRQLEYDAVEDKDRKATIYAGFVTNKYGIDGLKLEEVKQKILAS